MTADPAPQMFINVHGDILPAAEAKVSAMDHGFLYGDTVYETLRTFERVPFLLGRHLRRLERSTERIFMPLPLGRPELEAEVLRSVKEVPIDGDVMIRLVISRGVGPPGLDIELCTQPSYLVYVSRLTPANVPPEADATQGGGGVPVVISKTRRNSPRAVDPSVKSGNFLNNILAYKDAHDVGAYEAILCTAEGFLAEGATSNLFVVKDDFVWTPRSEGILAGITRAVVFEEARAAGASIGETNIAPETLFAADEVFLSSSVRGIVPVSRVNDGVVGSGERGPVTHRLQQLYNTRMERECRTQSGTGSGFKGQGSGS